MELETVIYDENDNEITVKAFVIQGQRGMHDSFGQQETPDDEDEIEIEAAFDDDDNEVELTDAQQEEAINNLYNEGY